MAKCDIHEIIGSLYRVGDMLCMPTRYATCLLDLQLMLTINAKNTGDPLDIAMSNFSFRCNALCCVVPQSIITVLRYAQMRLGIGV